MSKQEPSTATTVYLNRLSRSFHPVSRAEDSRWIHCKRKDIEMANNDKKEITPCPSCGSTKVHRTRLFHNCRLRGNYVPKPKDDKDRIVNHCPECNGALFDVVFYCHGCHRLEFNGTEVSPSIPLA
jgi:predicted RNA-binding Zn-ribbon protein involved in translation (DUF1610 family)